MMGFIDRVLRKTKPQTQSLYDRQLLYEAQGIAANNAGVTKVACPYDRDTQQLEWNFWNWGWDLTQNEREIVKAGGYFVSSTGENAVPFWVPLDNWKPKYLTSTIWHTTETK